MIKNKIIISLGGSLVVTKNGIDYKFLKKFRNLILERVKKGRRFFLIVGGGKTCRDYISAVAKVVKASLEDKDWLGIRTTRLNAHLLRIVLREVSEQKIITDPTLKLKSNKKVILAGGWKPGWSTDYVAVMLAQKNGIKKIINLTNIDYVYSKDPKKFKSAQRIKKINWQEYRKLISSRWFPGLNTPFDPVASAKAESWGLEVIIMNGGNLKNLKNYLDGKDYKGTLIK